MKGECALAKKNTGVLDIHTNYSRVENAVDVSLAPGSLRLAGAILSGPSGANLGRRLPPAPCRRMGMTVRPKFPRDVKRGMDSQGISAGAGPAMELSEAVSLPFKAYPQKEAMLREGCPDW